MEQLPILPLRGVVVYPLIGVTIDVGRSALPTGTPCRKGTRDRFDCCDTKRDGERIT